MDRETIQELHKAADMAGLSMEFSELLANAERYEWLRARDLDAIRIGGVFAGQVPQNIVLNGHDLDYAIDAESECAK